MIGVSFTYVSKIGRVAGLLNERRNPLRGKEIRNGGTFARTLWPTWACASHSITLRHDPKIENEKIDFGEYPSEDLIRKLARVLDVDQDELLILAKKIPVAIRERLFERPDMFRAIARCDDKTLDRLLTHIVPEMGTKKRATRKPR